jgi:hypothetical protein
MGHLLYLPKQYLTLCQSQQQKWDKSCLIADWTITGEQRQLLMIFTITAQCRSNRDDLTFSGRSVWKQRYTLKNTKSGHYFIHLEATSFEDKWTIRVQCGTNCKRMNIRRVKPFKEINLNNKLTQQNKKPVWSIKSMSINKEKITHLSEFSTLFRDLHLVVSIQTNHTWHITSTQLRDHFFFINVFFLIEPMLILHVLGRVT